MIYFVAAAACFGFPLLIGYIVGRKQVDPFTAEGKEYYR